MLYRDRAKNLFYGKLKRQNHTFAVTEEVKIDPALIDEQADLLISDDGTLIFCYQTPTSRRRYFEKEIYNIFSVNRQLIIRFL